VIFGDGDGLLALNRNRFISLDQNDAAVIDG